MTLVSIPLHHLEAPPTAVVGTPATAAIRTTTMTWGRAADAGLLVVGDLAMAPAPAAIATKAMGGIAASPTRDSMGAATATTAVLVSLRLERPLH